MKPVTRMAGTALHLAYTFDDYARFERDAKNKHEFVGGLILAMARGTIEHGALCATVLRGPRTCPCGHAWLHLVLWS